MEIGTTFNPYIFAIICLVLFIFGIAYNYLVGWLERTGHDRGYTAYLVIAGTLVTLLLAIPIIGFFAFLIVLACFAFSGLPMVIGSSARSSNKRLEDETKARQYTMEMVADDEKIAERLRYAAGDYASNER